MLKLDLFLTLIKWFFCLNLTRTYGLPLSKHTVDNWTKCSAILKTCKVHCYSESDLHRENVSTKSHTFVKHSHGFLSKYFLHCFKLFFFFRLFSFIMNREKERKDKFEDEPARSERIHKSFWNFWQCKHTHCHAVFSGDSHLVICK